MRTMGRIKEYFRNIFFIFSTFFLSPIFYFGVFFNKIKSQKDRLKILVIQRAKIGDLVCSTGMFKLIKEKYPDSYLAVLASIYTSDIIANNPYIDQIIRFDEGRSDIGYLIDVVRKLKKEKFRFSVSLQPAGGNFVLSFWSMIPCRVSTISRHAPISSKILSIFNTHNVEFKDNDMTFEHYPKILKFLSINVPATGIDLFTDEASERKAKNFLEKRGLSENDFLVGICPTAGNKLKEWELEKWIALSNLLIDNLNAKIIIIGAPGDSEIISKIRHGTKGKAVNAGGVFALGEIAAFFKKLKICVTSFSGPMHIADGVGVPVVAIAGPCNFHNQPPIGRRTKIVHHPVYCHPCVSFAKTARFCNEGHYLCIKDTNVDEVYDAVLSLIDKKEINS